MYVSRKVEIQIKTPINMHLSETTIWFFLLQNKDTWF